MAILGGRTRYCRWCGSAFTEMKNQRIYCSRTCEREARKSDKYAEGDPLPGKLLQPEVRICRTCGRPFVTDHEGRRYCSDKCRYHKDIVRAEMRWREMDECGKCYKFERCFERRGICTEYRSVDEIKEEIEAVMQSAKASGADAKPADTAGHADGE